VLALYAYVRVQREIQYFDSHLRAHAAAYAASLAHGIAAVEGSFGPQTALLLVGQANESSPQFRARWVGVDESGSPLEVPAVPLVELGTVRLGKRLTLELPGLGSSAGVLVTYVPVALPRAAFGRSAVEVTESLQEEQDFITETIRSTLLFSLGALVLTSAVAATLGMFFIGRPIRKLVDKAQRISGGDLSGPVVLGQRDELAVLASEMNSMCERLEVARRQLEAETAARLTALEQMRHADRLATLGRLAAGIAHEIGTPLAVAGGRTGMIVSGEVKGAEAVENARIAGEQLQRIAKIIRQLLDFVRRRPAQKEPVDLHALAARTCGLLQPLAAKRGVTLEVGESAPHSGPALGDLGQLEQALTNLVINAIQATVADGHVVISCARGKALPPTEMGGSEGEFAFLRVSDSGSGMNADTKSHIFEPFFTTKAIGEGTGLGLSVAYGIAREHGGWIDVESEPGKGSQFTLYLPAR
jgi:signal transduction histidine kinase